jgi:hypothetical protein
MSKELVAENRWDRRRGLLPQLRLSYPGTDESRKLCALARVDGPSIFSSHIRSIILDAHLDYAGLKELSAPRIKQSLGRITRGARQLHDALLAVDVDKKGSAMFAGMLFEFAMADVSFQGKLVLIPESLQFVDLITDAATRATRDVKPKRGPKAAGANLAFDRLIQSLQIAAWQRSGDWTVYRSADGTWTGSFLEALEILRPYLPDKFIPAGELGRSVEHIRKKFKNYITKNQT